MFSAVWDSKQTKLLIAEMLTFKELKAAQKKDKERGGLPNVQSSLNKEGLTEFLSRALKQHGYHQFTLGQIETKVHNLNTYYKRVHDNNKMSGRKNMEWEHYDVSKDYKKLFIANIFLNWNEFF